jgi:F-type H+-transporting ATPase subunit a
MSAVAGVREAVEYHLPHSIPLTLAMSWVVWIIVIVVSVVVARKATVVPKVVQGAFESIFSFVFSLADDIIGHEAHRYYPLFACLFVFILVANLIGLIPGFTSPTSDPNLTFGLAFLVFLYYNVEGVRKNGWKYLKHFCGPPLPWYLFPVTIIMVLIEVVTFFVKPFSMGLRLFCNIFSKELFLAILAGLILMFMNSCGNSGICIFDIICFIYSRCDKRFRTLTIRRHNE